MDKRGAQRAEEFGVELKLWRIRSRMLQAELAERIGVHATSISQWERGDRADTPDRDTVEALDEALGAGGSLTRAAGYGGEGSVVELPATAGQLPLPTNLTTDDIAVLLAVTRQLSMARQQPGQQERAANLP